MTVAIYYHPEAYSTDGPRLMGRNAAGKSFLRGFIRHSKTPEFLALVDATEHAAQFNAAVRSLQRPEPVKASRVMAGLPGANAIYLPGPGMASHAFQRSLSGHTAWSLCGVTHTTSSAAAMDAIADLLVAPVQPWDALICTSSAVKDNVARILQAQGVYLLERLGVTKLVLPQLPVIPLGIHAQDFVTTASKRQAARQSLRLDDESLVVLFAGRLSFHAKAHPLAMYQALEGAAKQTGKSVVLIESGWHGNESIERCYAETARMVCPSVRVITLDGRRPASRDQAWGCADIFCSLSDNIQETFGLTPIEAMAAGIPVVVSDWDGYKDTVRDGVDGFRIPTMMPPAGFATDLAARYALGVDTYDHYVGHASMLVSVDVAAATQAFIQLFESPALRRQMGDAGRQRAHACFDWRVIIPQYEALWAELDAMRCAEVGKHQPLPHPWPARLDPFYGFAKYATRSLTPDTRLSMAGDMATVQGRLQQLLQLDMVNFAAYVLPTSDDCHDVFDQLCTGPATVASLLFGLPEARRGFVYRGLCWMIKMGLLTVAPSVKHD